MNTVMKAEKELQNFLEENPHMKKDQEKINLVLRKTPKNKKVEVLEFLISVNLLKLQEQLNKLNQILVSTIN